MGILRNIVLFKIEEAGLYLVSKSWTRTIYKLRLEAELLVQMEDVYLMNVFIPGYPS